MLDVTLPITLLLEKIFSPFRATFSLTLRPHVLHFFSTFDKAFFPIKSFLSKSTNLPSPTEKGFVFLSKSCPAERRPASILLPLKDGVAVKIMPIFFPSDRIKSPIFSALFSGLK